MKYLFSSSLCFSLLLMTWKSLSQEKSGNHSRAMYSRLWALMIWNRPSLIYLSIIEPNTEFREALLGTYAILILLVLLAQLTFYIILFGKCCGAEIRCRGYSREAYSLLIWKQTSVLLHEILLKNNLSFLTRSNIFIMRNLAYPLNNLTYRISMRQVRFSSVTLKYFRYPLVL